MADEVLRIENLQAWYGESHVLHGVNMTVHKGEVVTLLGRNGAGRTSTLKSVLGLVGRRTGSIKVNGTETVTWPTYRIALLRAIGDAEVRGISSTESVEKMPRTSASPIARRSAASSPRSPWRRTS